LIGAVGVFSSAKPSAGVPYTAAVEEKTNCATPRSTQAWTRLRVPQVLLP